ncbi:hypothetical protein [uncultured Corynebacterium sp.]|uniref:hypothetical protein n=1 Tax=uncultured Corynebacterium sp. TaxID=159447 RepID=UPI00259293F1|nr:hypothetical protein [uncultured Corynebacterium sp.]
MTSESVSAFLDYIQNALVRHPIGEKKPAYYNGTMLRTTHKSLFAVVVQAPERTGVDDLVNDILVDHFACRKKGTPLMAMGMALRGPGKREKPLKFDDDFAIEAGENHWVLIGATASKPHLVAGKTLASPSWIVTDAVANSTSVSTEMAVVDLAEISEFLIGRLGPLQARPDTMGMSAVKVAISGKY